MNRISFLWLCLTLLCASEGREWEDVVEISIYSQSNVDLNRIHFATERDPDAAPTPEPTEYEDIEDTSMPSDLPSTLPTEVPTAMEKPERPKRTNSNGGGGSWNVGKPSSTEASIQSETETPTITPTKKATDAPTEESTFNVTQSLTADAHTNIPTESADFSCPPGTVLYRVDMFDQWGDGWDTTTISIMEMLDYKNQTYVARTEDIPHDINDDINNEINDAINDDKDATNDVPLESQNITNVEDKQVIYEAASRESRTTVVHDDDRIITISETVDISGSSRRKLELTFMGGLQTGPYGSRHTCLSTATCYNIIVSGGMWAEEIKWDLRPVLNTADVSDDNGPIVMGRAPDDCTFSVTSTGKIDHYCPLTCATNSATPQHPIDNFESVEPAKAVHTSTEFVAGHHDEVGTISAVHVTNEADPVAYDETELDELSSDTPSMIPSMVPSVTKNYGSFSRFSSGGSSSSSTNRNRGGARRGIS